MGVEIIYVVRHGHRMNFTVDPSTGTYSAARRTPTGNPADPELAKYGVDQSRELASHLTSLEPEIDVFYSSPFYRCLQTIKPTIERLVQNGKIVKSVRVENGVSEFFGAAPFAHPKPCSLKELETYFDFINTAHRPAIVPFEYGETMEELHDRNAYAMHRIISQVDVEAGRPKVILICTHAADMICIGRVLTGYMPADPTEEDFRCGTCALSKFVRRSEPETTHTDNVQKWSPENPNVIPKVCWRNGNGVKGGWDCVWNGDCSFLSGGEERTWNFSMRPLKERVSTPIARQHESTVGVPLLICESDASDSGTIPAFESDLHAGQSNRDDISLEVPDMTCHDTEEEADEKQTAMKNQAPAA